MLKSSPRRGHSPSGRRSLSLLPNALKPCRRRLRLESLEERTLLAVFTVNDFADTVDANPGDGLAEDAAGNTTLRAAIMESNALAGDNSIDLPAGTYTLSLTGENEDTCATGDLDITDTAGSLTITGTGAATTTIDANEIDRVFHVFTGAPLELSGVTLTGGKLEKTGADGGGICNFGRLTLTSTTVSGNSTGRSSSGGGIYNNFGIVTLTSSTVSDNSLGDYADGGGGIYNDSGTLTLTNTTVSDNSTGSSGRGGGIYSESGTLTLTNSTIAGNLGANDGGGICSLDGTLTVTDSTLSGNSVKGTYSDGGGIFNSDGTLTLTNTTLSGNSAFGKLSRGGGICNDDGILRLTNSTVSGNAAAGTSSDGGGIYNSGAATLTKLTLSGNSAGSSTHSGFGTNGFGGGVYNDAGTLTLTSSTVSGNWTGTRGGGLNNSGGTLTLTNSVLSGNSARYSGGGIQHAGTLTLTNSTLSDNSTTDTLGEGGGVFSVGGTVTLNNSIVARNQAAQDFREIAGAYTSQSSLVGVNPGFVRNPSDGGDGWRDDPATSVDESANNDYGDLRLTASSIAIDMGDTALLPSDAFDLDRDGDTSEPLPVDLDGDARVAAGTVDLGAFEFQGTPAEFETPSTVVTTVSDIVDRTDGLVSIREAVVYATLGDVTAPVTFNTALSGGVIPLDGTELYLVEDLCIDASTVGGITLNANSLSRVIGVYANASVELTALQVVGGASGIGGGIYSCGALTLTDTTLSDSSATAEYDGHGGGIYNDGGTLTLTNSTLSGNSVSGNGGGIYNGEGTLTLMNSTLAGNSAWDAGGGVFNEVGTLTLMNSTLAGNSAWDDGGGVYNEEGTLTLTNSTLAGNSAHNGGGIYNNDGMLVLTNSTLASNLINGTSGDGGGIYNEDGTLTLTNTMLADNSTWDDGGGIYSDHGTLTLTDSTLSGNSAGADGGGAYLDHSTLMLMNSTLANNTAGYDGDGGGIYKYSGMLTLTNSVLADNSTGDGGCGGGIYDYSGTLTVTNSTLAGNSAGDDGGGVYSRYDTMTVANSLVWGNTAPSSYGRDIYFYGGSKAVSHSLYGSVYGSFVDGGGNLSVDPLFVDAPSGNYHLQAVSPAIDAGDNSLVPVDVTTDQDGSPRVFDGDLDGTDRVDMGAYELAYDFGDAPASTYPTLLAQGGARHLATGPKLGGLRDVEWDGLPDAEALGDDSDNLADEDGVTFGVIRVGQLDATVVVNVQEAPTGAKLDAWVDFNSDGAWGGTFEQVADSVDVTAGDNVITFDVPSWAVNGDVCARFRLSTVGGLAPNGVATDGEVEDYHLTLDAPGPASGKFASGMLVAPNANRPRDVFAADMDGDGDMDVLSASAVDDKIAWYENDGAENFTIHTITTSADDAYSVFAADMDGDGDMDVLSASAADNRIAWYENDGAENFTIHTITTSADGARSVFAADVDSDGDMDVLSASDRDDKIAWYENDGHGHFSAHTITTSADFAQSVFVADVDGDGDMDVLSASQGDDKIAWYENDGAESFTTHTITAAADGASCVFAADVDSDGDMDVLSASSWDNMIAWYENDGSENFTTHAITTSADYPSSVFAADIDGDGDMDVLSSGGRDLGIAWHENNGAQSFTTHALTTEPEAAHSILAADVDGDGDIDLLSTGGPDLGVAWHENDGATNFAAHAISSTVSSPEWVLAADMDGDGDMDVLSASWFRCKIVWYENDGAENFTMHVITTSADYIDSIFAADLDGDGDLDVLSGTRDSNKLAWYENDGAEGFTAHMIATTAGAVRPLFAADMDGDGDLDVLSVPTDERGVAWYENDGAQGFTVHTIATSDYVPSSVSAADVDGDGDMDVLAASGAYRIDQKVTWYENDGAENFTAHGIHRPNLPSPRSVSAVDMDGDGDMDVLAACAGTTSDRRDSVVWYENDGAENFTPRAIATTVRSTRSVFAADVDGDGDIDVLLASSADDTIAWYENDGTERFSAHTITTSANQAYSVLAADMDGDSDLDVLAAIRSDNAIIWYENEGFDFGDAPDPTYATLLGEDGARHVASGPTLGALRDAEFDGQPNSTAMGDDVAVTADEDGLVSYMLPDAGDQDATLNVSVSEPAYLNAWIDFDQNGTWDADELLLGGNIAIDPSTPTVTFDMPSDAVPGKTFVRLRLTSEPMAAPLPTGLAPDGEVEDHLVTIGDGVYIHGGPGTDVFRVETDGATHTVTVNGVATDYDATLYPTLEIAGDEHDKLYVYDSSEADHIAAGADQTTVDWGADDVVEVTATNIPRVYLYATPGDGDTATLTGTSDAERYYGYATHAKLKSVSGPLHIFAKDFETVTGVSGGGADTAYLHGGEGAVDDTLTYAAGLNKATLTRAGLPTSIAEGFEKTHAYAKDGGTDTATLTGSFAAESFYGREAYGLLLEVGGPRQTFAHDFDTVTAVAFGGAPDTARLFGSDLDDTLTVSPGMATMERTGSSTTVANGYATVHSYALAGDNDEATMHGTDLADRFFSFESYARMQNTAGGFYYQTASGFDTVTGVGGGGADLAKLLGSTGTDTLTGLPNSVTMARSGSTTGVATGFARVFADALTGADDTATLTGSDQVDRFRSYETYSVMQNTGPTPFFHHVKNFDAITGKTGGGADTAYLTGGAGDVDDTLTTTADWAKLERSGLATSTAEGYASVYINAMPGGTDTAHMTGSAHGDRLRAYVTHATMDSTDVVSYSYRAAGFGQYTVAGGGGTDLAYLYDSAGNDDFDITRNSATVTLNPAGGTIGYNISQFAEIRAFALNGDTGIGPGDTASVEGTTGAETFFGKLDFAIFSGTGFYNKVQYFDAVHADTGDDTPDNDTLYLVDPLDYDFSDDGTW